MTALSILRLVPKPGRIDAGSVRLAGRELRGLPVTALRRVRGAEIAMIFQEPVTSLNPVQTVGAQVVEAITLHERVARGEARRRALALFEQVGIPDPPARFDAYPHQLSGGLKQRVMIAIALAARPQLLIADEPTTALDVTIQAQILELLRAPRARDRHGDPADHARSRRRERARRPRRRDVRGPHRGRGHARGGARRAAPSLHAGAAALDAGARRAGRAAGRDPRRRARARRVAGGLSLRRSLRARDGRVPRARARARRRSAPTRARALSRRRGGASR